MMAPSTVDGHRSLEAIKYSRGNLSILDQLALPHETRYVAVSIIYDQGWSLTWSRSPLQRMGSTQSDR